MKAIVFEALGRSVLGDIPEPEPGGGEVLVKVAAAGICHTDLDILSGRYLARYPVVPGHEFAGTVIATGEGVARDMLGSRVAIDPLLPCGTCRSCRSGRINLCKSLAAYGATQNGAFAPYVAVRAANTYPIGDLPFAVAALAEPFSCVMHGVGQALMATTQQCLIFGAGPIGLMMLLALNAAGITDVTMVDMAPDRLAVAAELGAARTLEAGGLTPTSIDARFDFVADCTGMASVCQSLIGYARNGAKILFFGVCPPGEMISLSPNEIFRRELSVVGSHSLCGELPRALDVLRRSGPKAERLVSHRLPLEAIADYFRQRPARTMKVQYAAES